MKRAGYTLIEIMIVVGIIAIILSTAVMSVASGRGAVKVKEATRGVMQLSRYASALSLLRQRPVVVTYHKNGRIEVRISGEAAGNAAAPPSEPIYREVNGEMTVAAAEIVSRKSDAAESDPAVSGSSANGGQKGFFYTRQVLDPEVLAKEDADGEYEGVTFTVEVLDEEGNVLAPDLAAARTLRQPERKKTAVSEFGGLDPDAKGNADDKEDADGEDDLEEPVSVTYEPNGSVNPYRVIIRTSGASETDEGFTISISRSGKATVENEDEEDGRGRGRRRNDARRR